MAPIDNSIYFQQQAPDFVGAVQNGMKLSDMARDRRKKQEQDDFDAAKKSGMSMSELAKINPDMAREEQVKRDEFDRSQMDKKIQGVEYIARVGPNIKDQASYDSVLADLSKMGHDTSDMPKAYDPNLVNRYTSMAMSYADRMKLENDKANRNDARNLKLREIEAQEKMAGMKAASGENMPIDKKHFVDTIATKNANKVAIKNQIDSVMGGWDALPDDQKVAAGRSLLKTLNSSEGADAIGAEEAKRLGSKLEFALGNFTNSNPIQFGRDLKGFKDQAVNASKGIAGAIDANQAEIDRVMGRSRPSAPSAASSDYSKMSDEQIMALYNQRVKGQGNANAR